MIESKFGYGKGYVKGYNSSNFPMSDASNLASIALLALIPMPSYLHIGCFCVECSAILHEREMLFDTIKTEIEKCMEIAWQQGREYERG